MSNEKLAIDADAIRELAALLDETGLTEIAVENGGRKLRVARSANASSAHLAAAAAGYAPSVPEAVVEARPAALDASHPGAVKSPMVGTAYLAPEPGAAPYVKVGDLVGEGDTLVIIEAMKVMNPIRAPRSGRIVDVLVENASPVEYGQILMVID